MIKSNLIFSSPQLSGFQIKVFPHKDQTSWKGSWCFCFYFLSTFKTSPRTPKALTPKVGWLEFQCKAGLSAVGPLFHGKMTWRNELYSEWWRERWPLLIPTLLAASRLFQQPHCSEVKSEGEKPQRSPFLPSCCRTTPSIQRFEKLPGLSSRGRTSLHSASYELE